MLLDSVFTKFVERKPFSVMARAVLERMLSASHLDELFRTHAGVQYERDLLFSQLVEVTARVVTRVDRSVLKSIESLREVLTVTDEAVYQKLRGVETHVCQALVRDSFQETSQVLQKLKAEDKAWVRGFHTKILDGNSLAATEHRIAELRTIWDAPLPGRTLVVWDQTTRLVRDVFLSECGHAQERSLLDQVLETAQQHDLWIADRNFCTLGFLFGLWMRKARFVIRQHGTLVGKPVGKPRFVGKTARGEKVYEQAVVLTHEGRERTVRRVTVHLKTPTRDGDTQLHILTNLTEREASGAKVAELYQRRWTIEVVFHELTMALRCEVNTLGYPKAALFVFSVALVLENTLAMLNGSLRAVHGDEAVDELSGDALAYELQGTYEGMMVAIPPEHWRLFATMSLSEFVKHLKSLAKRVDVVRYRKHRRGPKKPAPARGQYHNGGHASTAKILALRNAQK
ncbi:MAG: transposase [Candidatus Binataceae bacterium]